LNRAIADDLDALKNRLADCDVCVDAVAIDMDRPPQRIRPDARYRLMEEHFERCGPAGRWMMNNTASTQLNVSMPGSTTRAWRLLHAIGPLLTAAFANSPGRCADGTSWASLRQGCWLHIDRTRTAAPGPGIDPIEEYLQYVMASGVFVVPGGDGPIAPPPGLTMGAWIHHGVAGRHATLADLRYHLTTLFPPVRPRGWFELRMIDSVPETDLPSVVAVGMALLDEPTVDELTARTITCPGGEFDAARYGLSAAPIHAAATELFDVIAEGLRHSGNQAASSTIESYSDRVIGPMSHSPRPDVASAWRPSWSDVTMTTSPECRSLSPRTGEAACAADLEVAHVPAH
jgi:glutamate--cysteine ligase